MLICNNKIKLHIVSQCKSKSNGQVNNNNLMKIICIQFAKLPHVSCGFKFSNWNGHGLSKYPLTLLMKIWFAVFYCQWNFHVLFDTICFPNSDKHIFWEMSMSIAELKWIYIFTNNTVTVICNCFNCNSLRMISSFDYISDINPIYRIQLYLDSMIIWNFYVYIFGSPTSLMALLLRYSVDNAILYTISAI